MGAAPILTILKDGEMLRAVPLEGEALLGRDEGCVIRLEGRMISRQHALFSRKGDQIQVEKKSEFAPLLLNGSECSQAVLKEGDVISIGPYLMKLSMQREKNENSSAQAFAPVPVHAAAQPVIAAPEPVTKPMAVSPDEQALPSLDVGESAGASTFESPVESASPVLSAASTMPALDLGAPDLSPAAQSEGTVDILVESASANASPSEGSAVGLVMDGAVAEESSMDSVPASLDPPGALTLDPPDVPSLDSQLDDGGATKILRTSGPEMRLVFKPGQANVLDFRMEKDEISIGRGKDCDIILSDKKVSRKNAVISKNGPVAVIKDLGSSNGTYVNGSKITEQALAGGDKIRIGEAEFVFHADQPGYAAQEKDFLSVPALIEPSSPIELPPYQTPSQHPSSEAAQPNAFAPVPGVMPEAPIAGTDGIAGIAGIPTPQAGKQKGFMAKFRALPKQRQWLVIVLVIAFGYFVFLDDDETQAPPQKQTQKKNAKDKKPADGSTPNDSKAAARAFAALSRERQDFIRTQHKLAFEYFQHKDYANTLVAIKPIFEYVDDYEDSRVIQRYAEEGLRQMKIIAEEKAKKEAEEAKIRKITELLNRARALMDKRKYAEATPIFNDILVIDPENAQVAQWQTKIRQYEEDLKIQEEKRQVQREVNNQAWAVYKEGVALRQKGQLHRAIDVFLKVKDIGAVDARPARSAAQQIKEIYDEIKTQLEPLLKDGKEKEDAQNYPEAMAAYAKALQLEPSSEEALKGQARVRDVLIERAKVLYTEGVLAESYSDFAVAKKKFKQCVETAPKESPYHDRANRKLARYFKYEEAIGTPAGGTGPEGMAP